MIYLAKSKLREIDFMAKRYGVLPNEIMGLDFTDFQLNCLIMNEGISGEKK